MQKLLQHNKPVGSWRAIDDFSLSVETWPDRPALRVDGRALSYRALNARVGAIATAIEATETDQNAPVAAIYANRGADTYAMVLAALMRGYTYVPLNPKFPASRNRYILDKSGASVVLCDQSGQAAVTEILAEASAQSAPPAIICDTLPDGPVPATPPHHENDYCYTLFTSGSTGQPKGVPIRHSNLAAYLDAVFQVADYSHTDRLSQNFDLTFDLSAHDMFVCWRAGAELIVPSAADLERPGKYLVENDVTCWFSVPSLAQKMRLQGDLSPKSLTNLRLSLFCGEALPIDLARDWVRATGQRVENWYGPTEATIACTRYVIPKNPKKITGRFDLVPIGAPLPGMRALILDEAGQDAAPGQSGELLVSGPQVADGYLGDPDKTAAAFVHPHGEPEIYYRTGDRVQADRDGTIQFIDRIDNQIKIRGYRVELGEIESELRAIAQGCNAVVVALPLKSPTPTSLVAVIEAFPAEANALLPLLARKLPDYMTPTRIMSMKQFPKNASGKVDRGQIGERVLKRLSNPAGKIGKAGGGGKAGKAGKAGNTKKLRRYDVLANMVRSINPAISRDDIERAGNMMDAGLDSLGFVEFTALMENRFDLALDQQIVSDLSHMSMRQIVIFTRKALEKRDPDRFKVVGDTSKGNKPLSSMHYRAMRALDMLDKFPGFVADTADPLVACVGSSGFMRSISTTVLETTAQQAGQKVRAANLGMGMLSVTGITEVCEYVRDTLKAKDKRLAHAVIELEIMHLSVLPPAGDIEIVNDYKSGTFDSVERKYYDDDTIWDARIGGMIPAAKTTRAAPKPANWEMLRSREILEAFEGRTTMDEKSIATWITGVLALKEVSDQVTAVIHPIQYEGIEGKRQAVSPNLFQALIEHLKQETGVRIMLDTEFTLDMNDFKNISHMNDHIGRQKFSEQIGRLVFLGKNTIQTA